MVFCYLFFDAGWVEHDRAELENRTEQFDIIIGDLADPVAGGPCYQLYTKSFYEHVLKPRLKDGGILVTQVRCLTQMSYTGFFARRMIKCFLSYVLVLHECFNAL